MHDGSEAYLGDVTSPLKSLLDDYRTIESKIERALMKAFEIPFPLSSSVKYADLVLLSTEQRDLMPRGNHDWAVLCNIHPLDEVIVPLSPAEAEKEFLDHYQKLLNERHSP